MFWLKIGVGGGQDWHLRLFFRIMAPLLMGGRSSLAWTLFKGKLFSFHLLKFGQAFYLVEKLESCIWYLVSQITCASGVFINGVLGTRGKWDFPFFYITSEVNLFIFSWYLGWKYFGSGIRFFVFVSYLWHAHPHPPPMQSQLILNAIFLGQVGWGG